MNEGVDSQKQDVVQDDHHDIGALFKKIQDRLDEIEGKIDSLIRQSKPKTFEGKSYARPHKDHAKGNRHSDRKYEGKKDEVSSEGKFYHGRPFGKTKIAGKGPFKAIKKPFRKSSKKK